MGAYVNPPSQTKESWLEAHGERLPAAPASLEAFHAQRPDSLPVCVVDNGWMTAAGVTFDQNELEAFSVPGDPRPKRWFAVPRELLLQVSDLAHYERGVAH